MKKLFSIMVVMLLVACSQNEAELKDDQIYFFYSNSCIHCHHAIEYINAKYPDLDVAMVNVANSNGYNLLVEAAKKYGLTQSVGTPLITFGNNYLMGWAKQYEAKFDEYCKPFVKNN